MRTVDCIRLIDSEHDAAKRDEDYTKGYRIGKNKLTKVYLYCKAIQ